ncbi:MAG TPA: hypothetical protein VMS55_03055 [Myxococcota bacterium]|nr:hypothetical protein [Myxococcota bacterium]
MAKPTWMDKLDAMHREELRRKDVGRELNSPTDIERAARAGRGRAPSTVSGTAPPPSVEN